MKDIKGYEGIYKITKDGNVFSVRNNKFLKLNLKTTGYVNIELNYEGKDKHYRVHRLVAEAFIPNPHNKPFVNHLNGVKSDNRVENLEWVTPTENNIHALKTGLAKSRNNIYLVYNIDNVLLKSVQVI